MRVREKKKKNSRKTRKSHLSRSTFLNSTTTSCCRPPCLVVVLHNNNDNSTHQNMRYVHSPLSWRWMIKYFDRRLTIVACLLHFHIKTATSGTSRSRNEIKITTQHRCMRATHNILMLRSTATVFIFLLMKNICAHTHMRKSEKNPRVSLSLAPSRTDLKWNWSINSLGSLEVAFYSNLIWNEWVREWEGERKKNSISLE